MTSVSPPGAQRRPQRPSSSAEIAAALKDIDMEALTLEDIIVSVERRPLDENAIV